MKFKETVKQHLHLGAIKNGHLTFVRAMIIDLGELHLYQPCFIAFLGKGNEQQSNGWHDSAEQRDDGNIASNNPIPAIPPQFFLIANTPANYGGP